VGQAFDNPPVLEDVVGWDAARIRQLSASQGLVLQAWDKARTDWVTLRGGPERSLTMIEWLATAVLASPTCSAAR
jgi:hypothetical protein